MSRSRFVVAPALCALAVCGCAPADPGQGTGPELRLVAGRIDNIKVTQPEDLALAEAILRERGRL